ncbi:hypothetical protein CBR_g40266 [Chara braunii]|uniref:Integrase catalytic domain-containing protein n=1 Tax=Chara braunii TaxID=69332 RepID=A0A388K1T8_CHABU|nr:hypothetical protein CBR_g40266 [Chara braunii]|eukprot:GBG64020.1 hypothetical protein CBR_g40266 [Chara braunii]
MFQDLLEDFVLVYIDDILIYSRTLEDHLTHLRTVLQRLRDDGFYAKLSKCIFAQAKVDFLRHQVSEHGLHMDDLKIQAIVDWPTPTSLPALRSFLVLTNYYGPFLKNYVQYSSQLTPLTRRRLPFHWTPAHEDAFRSLKRLVTSAPVLHLPDYSRPFIVTTDASDFAIGAVLYQIYPAPSTAPDSTESRLPRIPRFPPPPPATAAHLTPIEPTPLPPYIPDVADDGTVGSRDGECLVAYLSRQLRPTERNYIADEREVLAPVYVVKKWRHHLHGHTFTILTDNSVLAAFHTKPKLTSRQARRWRDLSEFDFTIKKISGESNRVADALSRPPDLQCEDRQLSTISAPTIHPAFLDEYRRAYTQCPEFQSIYADLQAGKFVPNFKLDPSRLLYWLGRQGTRTPRLCVPSTGQLCVRAIAECHDQRAAGHLGVFKTLDRLYRHYYWEHHRPFTKEYVRTCRICQEANIPNPPPYGLLQPLPIPTQRWTSVSMDFIGPLRPPTPRGHDAIFVVVCRLTKHAHFLPCKYASSAKDIASLYFNRIAIHHGLPTSIVFDRDPRFTSHFWRGLHEIYGSELRLSSSYHPQSDGQAEVTNKTLGSILKKFVENDSDWDLHLAHAEIAYNHAISPATGMSPYYYDLGYHPRVPSDLLRPSQIHPDTKCPALDDWVKEMDALLSKARESIADSQTRMTKLATRFLSTHVTSSLKLTPFGNSDVDILDHAPFLHPPDPIMTVR